MILVLLQNAWSRFYRRIGRPDDDHSNRNRIWGRDSWLEATWASASGRALRKLLAGVPEEQIWLDDTTLEIAETPAGIKPIDPAHVAGLLARQPEVVIACGKQAERAVVDWPGRLIVMPHPAYRLLNSRTVAKANEIILSGEPPRCNVWPARAGQFVVTEFLTDAELADVIPSLLK